LAHRATKKRVRDRKVLNVIYVNYVKIRLLLFYIWSCGHIMALLTTFPSGCFPLFHHLAFVPRRDNSDE